MVSLGTYFSISTLLAIGSIYHSYSIHEQFYPTVVYLTNDKLCILSLGNFAFCSALTIANIVIRIFFSNVGDDETNEILLRAKYSVTEICIALTSFRNELTKTVVMLFVALLFVKAFHWLAVLRMENFARGQHVDTTLLSKMRLFCSLLFLLMIDVFAASVLSYLLYQSQRFSVNVLFAFEFTILSASVFTQICKFFIILIDRRYDERWSYKPVIMFIFEFLHDLTHLGLYSVFIWILTMNWGFPLHLLRELFVAFHNLRNRVVHFYNYSRIIKVLDTQFKTVSRQEIIDSDRDVVCVICFAEMDSGKELPCKHVFHLNCLKRWFEQKQECPMCRFKIVPKKERRQRPRRRVRDGDGNENGNRDRNRVVNPVPNDNALGPDGAPNQNNDDNVGTEEKQQFEFKTASNVLTPTASFPFPASGTNPMFPPTTAPPQPFQGYAYPSYDGYQPPYCYPAAPPPPMPYGSPPYYPPVQSTRNGPNSSNVMTAELEQLARVTQRQIEFHEMHAKHLRMALDHYIALQSQWREEDQRAGTGAGTGADDEKKEDQ